MGVVPEAEMTELPGGGAERADRGAGGVPERRPRPGSRGQRAGTDLATESADIVLARSDPRDVAVLLSPAGGAVLMLASTVVVAINARLLGRWNPQGEVAPA